MQKTDYSTITRNWARNHEQQNDPDASPEKRESETTIRLRAPEGVSVANGVTGAYYRVGQGGIIIADQEDVAALVGSGFMRVADDQPQAIEPQACVIKPLSRFLLRRAALLGSTHLRRY